MLDANQNGELVSTEKSEDPNVLGLELLPMSPERSQDIHSQIARLRATFKSGSSDSEGTIQALLSDIASLLNTAVKDSVHTSTSPSTHPILQLDVSLKRTGTWVTPNSCSPKKAPQVTSQSTSPKTTVSDLGPHVTTAKTCHLCHGPVYLLEPWDGPVSCYFCSRIRKQSEDHYLDLCRISGTEPIPRN